MSALDYLKWDTLDKAVTNKYRDKEKIPTNPFGAVQAPPKFFDDGGYIVPQDNTRVNTPIVLPVEREHNFPALDYFWDSSQRYPSGLWEHKDGTFHATRPEDGEDVILTREEADSIVRATKAKNRREKLRRIVEEHKRSDGSPINVLCGGGYKPFALGGDLQSHGADWSTGSMHIDAGGSHEENEYDGVQLGTDSEGTPNLVEEGEVVFNDYVYSKRITLDQEAKERFHFPKKTELTYADAAKKLEKEISERPNDPVSRAGFKAQMEDLAEQQERQKQEMEAERAEEAFNALSDEEKVALMQQLSQQEQMAQEQAIQQQAAQEQAMAQEAMAQQGVSPEEMAMAQQQMSPEETTMMQQQMAYGGKVNRYDLGGDVERWLKKSFPKTSSTLIQELKKVLVKRISAKYPNGVPSGVDFGYFYNSLAPKFSWKKGARSYSEEEQRKTFDALIADGMTPKGALAVLKGYHKWSKDSDENKKKWDNLFHEWTTKGSAASSNESSQFKSIPGWDNELKETAPWRANTVNNENAIQANTLNMSTQAAMVQAARDAGISNPEEYVEKRYRAEEGKGTQQATKAGSAARPGNAGATTASSNQKGAKEINIGSWNDNKDFAQHWQTYAAPGLNSFLTHLEEAYNNASSEEEKAKIANDAIEQFNNLQKSYRDYVLPGRDKTRFSKDDNIWNHQTLWNSMHGNEGFWSQGNDGSLNNYIAKSIDLPEGHFTSDTPSGNGIDGYNGHRTFLRTMGTTEAGDDAYYSPYKKRFEALGIDFSPYDEWSYGDDLSKKLYKLSPRTAASIPEEGLIEGEDYYVVPEEEAEKDDFVVDDRSTKEERKVVPALKDESLRYAGLFGPLVGLGLMSAGVGKPDTSGIDAAISLANSPAYLASYKPIGNYLTYRPLDTWFEQNRMNATARAADRTIMNSSLPTATKFSALLANNYNDQLASGNLFRQAQEYNDNLKKQVGEFNRGTDMFNAQAYNQNSQFNAEARNRSRNYAASLAMQGAAQKMDADAGWYNSLYGNINGLFKGLSDLGREKADRNWIARLAASGGIPGIVPENAISAGLLEYADEAQKRKKKKWGLFNI